MDEINYDYETITKINHKDFRMDLTYIHFRIKHRQYCFKFLSIKTSKIFTCPYCAMKRIFNILFVCNVGEILFDFHWGFDFFYFYCFSFKTYKEYDSKYQSQNCQKRIKEKMFNLLQFLFYFLSIHRIFFNIKMGTALCIMIGTDGQIPSRRFMKEYSSSLFCKVNILFYIWIDFNSTPLLQVPHLKLMFISWFGFKIFKTLVHLFFTLFFLRIPCQ